MVEFPGQLKDLGHLSDYAPALADVLVAVSSDIVLLLDAKGVIEKVMLSHVDTEALNMASSDWVGRAFEDTVTEDTRRKVDELLREVATTGVSKLRHLNHPNPAGSEIPIAYKALRLGQKGPTLAVGRDLRMIVAMQQRFVTTQQEMERSYWKLRQAETRYQLLFQVATDAVFVIDPVTLRVTDANQAAARVFGMTAEQLTGKSPAIGIEPEFGPALDRLLTTTLVAGRSAEIRVRLAKGGYAARVSATTYCEQGPTVLLLRINVAVDTLLSRPTEATLLALVERTEDAIVVTDATGHVMTANPAFANLLEIEAELLAIGKPLGTWLGVIDNSVPLAISTLIQNGTAPLFVTTLRTEKGKVVQVELSATLLPDGEDKCFGFILRPRRESASQLLRDVGDTSAIKNIH